MRGASLLLAAGLLLAGCSGDGDEEPTESLTAVNLDPSGDQTTAGATPSPSTTATASANPSPTPTTEPILLTGHGLTILNLGAEIQDAMLSLEGRFGPPDADTGWQLGNQTSYGVCPGDATRGVRWGALTALFFRNAPNAEGEWLSAYQLSSFDSSDTLGIVTPRGVTIGSTVAEIEAAYGADAEISDGAPFYDGIVELTDTVPNTNDQATLFGTLDGVDPTNELLFLQAGTGCGE